MEESIIHRRPRIKVKPDSKLLAGLKTGDQNALQMALNKKDAAALAAIEEAIAFYRGNSDFSLYQAGGTFEKTTQSQLMASMELVTIAQKGGLLRDPAYTQHLIARAGERMNQQILAVLSENSQTFYAYQLLGIQMQLGVLVDSPSKKIIPWLVVALFLIGLVILLAVSQLG